MFEFLFKYPYTAFSRGKLVWLGAGPGWLPVALIVAGAGLLAFLLWRRRLSTGAFARTAIIWGLQSAFLALLLAMLWQPALSISTLKPQQNIVAVVVDDSHSMGLADNGAVRRDEVRRALDRMLPSLRERFQVRLYRLGGTLERIASPEALKANLPSTDIAGGSQATCHGKLGTSGRCRGPAIRRQ